MALFYVIQILLGHDVHEKNTHEEKIKASQLVVSFRLDLTLALKLPRVDSIRIYILSLFFLTLSVPRMSGALMIGFRRIHEDALAFFLRPR